MEHTKIGVHSLIFTDQWTEPNARLACETAADIGYDLIEVLIFDPTTIDQEMTGRVVGEAGLELRLGMALGPDTDISSTDDAVARAGEATVAQCLEIASELGTPAVSGITYAAFKNYTQPPTSAQRQQVAEALHRLDRRAGELGVKLGLEPVNRYESYLINTIDQAGDMIRSIDAKNMFIHMDTFHMNIEEPRIAGSIARNAELLGYVHLAESNRGALGGGNFDFERFFSSLKLSGYSGEFTVESFSPDRLSADISGAIKLWRNPWNDSEAVARQSLSFIRSSVESAALAAQAW